MSIALYRVRLWWDGRQGQARYYGDPVRLASCPDIGVRVTAIDYAPASQVRQIQPYACGWRDMTAPEERRLVEFLKGLP